MAEEFTAVVPAQTFRLVGQPDLPEHWWPLPADRQEAASDILRACLIDCPQSDGSKLRLFGELRTDGDGTMTFTQQGPSHLPMPEPNGGGENGDK